mgnify:FL=1
MATRKRKKVSKSKRVSRKRKAIKVPYQACVALCTFPCFEITVEFNQQTLALVSVDLFDAANQAWANFPVGMLNANGMAAAMNALRQATQNVNVETPCPEPGCVCDIPANKPPFTPWVNVNVSGGFSIPAPMGGPALQYRANGTVDMRSRVTPGKCIPVVIDA